MVLDRKMAYAVLGGLGHAIATGTRAKYRGRRVQFNCPALAERGADAALPASDEPKDLTRAHWAIDKGLNVQDNTGRFLCHASQRPMFTP
jgi:hypothetical protein